MKLNVLIFILLVSVVAVNAQQERQYVRKGNELYYAGNLSGAEEQYNLALDKNSGLFQAYFNKGNVFVQQDSFDLAADAFEVAASLTDDKMLRSQAYHNLGNSYMESANYEKSVEAYKNALRNNPNDQDTRYNLSYAMKKIQEQQPENQKPEDQKQDEDEGEDEDKGKQNPDQENDPDQEDKQGEKNNDPKDPKEGENGNPDDAKKNDDATEENDANVQPKQGQLSKAEAERLLEALQNEEQKVQLKLQRQEKESDPKKIDKDW